MAYTSLVPRDVDPRVVNVFEHRFEQHAPSPEAIKDPPRVIGSDTIPPIVNEILFLRDLDSWLTFIDVHFQQPEIRYVGR